MKAILKNTMKLDLGDGRIHALSMKLIPENIPVCLFLFMKIFSRYYFFSFVDWNSQSNNYLI